jgi:hypothetical protein
MKKAVVLAALIVVALGLYANSGHRELKARLRGFQEVPSVSSAGSGEFHARISNDESSITYELKYSGLEAPVTVAHIHFGQVGVNGGVSVFLCGGGNKPACPNSGPVNGTIVANDVIGPAGQGIGPGQLGELIRAIRAGVTYANVHSTLFPGGELRGQIRDDD